MRKLWRKYYRLYIKGVDVLFFFNVFYELLVFDLSVRICWGIIFMVFLGVSVLVCIYWDRF